MTEPKLVATLKMYSSGETRITVTKSYDLADKELLAWIKRRFKQASSNW